MSTSSDRVETSLPARWVARHAGDFRGPTFVVFGAMHGNEGTGVEAIEIVRDELAGLRARMHGTFIGLVGNTRALADGVRFLSRDLNRHWFPRDIEALISRGRSTQSNGRASPEDFEQAELLDILHKIIAGSPKPINVLDLHSTSSRSPAFCCMSDTLVNQSLAFALRVPVIFGLEETIEGTMAGYLSDLGHVCVAFEGGVHGDPQTLSAQVASIWVGLVTAGLLRREDVPRFSEYEEKLATVGKDLPDAVEILYRHAITPGDGFAMKPGYSSFQSLRAGEVVAEDKRGEIRSPASGRMLMPLYQGQGEDGFFVARDLGQTRLQLSRTLRRVQADRVLGLVPGFDRKKARGSAGNSLRVRGGLAGEPVKELLRLFGYRRVRQDQDGLVFSRRRQRPPR
jgi:succinylglutamate desuccinylase